MARKIFIWRHGRTAWNLENRFQGHTDIPLDDTGIAQAARAAALLASFSPHTILCSDLGRARQTAEPLIALTGLTAIIEPGIRETHGGQWEGRTGAEIRCKKIGRGTGCSGRPAHAGRGGGVPAKPMLLRRTSAEEVPAEGKHGLAVQCASQCCRSQQRSRAGG